MKRRKLRICLVPLLAVLTAAGSFSTAWAAQSMPRPGEEIEAQMPKGRMDVTNEIPLPSAVDKEIRFTVHDIDLDATELKLNEAALTRILEPVLHKEITFAKLQETVNALTVYCRQHGYPAAAAFLPVQDSIDGGIKIQVIPGRYDKVHIENHSGIQEDAIRCFLRGLKAGEIIRTGALETALYGISDLAGTRAVGVLSPGSKFGTSDLTVRVEKGKVSSTVLYVENYGSNTSGRYRYGLQESLYNVDGRGGKMNAGVLFSNHNMHNYYANYERLVGRSGTTMGIGLSRMDYTLGAAASASGANGTADTVSLFGKTPIFHHANRFLKVTYGLDYRKMKDDFDKHPDYNREKHSTTVHVGLTGMSQQPGSAVNYDVTLTAGQFSPDSTTAVGKILDELMDTSKTFAKVSANVTGVQAIGHTTDVMLKLQGQTTGSRLDSSEQMYLGGANGVRAYPQGEGSGDKGLMGTLELRYHTPYPGLILSTYFDAGHTSMTTLGMDTTTTLKGWGVGVSYTKAEDWFARFDYARRIGDGGTSDDAKSKSRMWFILGKFW